MTEPAMDEPVEVLSDGTTVWVNDADGMCIGRFGPRGVDIHATMAAQRTGVHCLDCTFGPTRLAHWRAFQDGMRRHHGVVVTDCYLPRFLREAASADRRRECGPAKPEVRE